MKKRYDITMTAAEIAAMTDNAIDFSVAFLVVAAMTMAAAPVALFMPRTAGDDLTGRRSVAPRAGE